MSRANGASGPAVLRGLALAASLSVVLGATLIGWGGNDLVPALGVAFGSTGQASFTGFAWGVVAVWLPWGPSKGTVKAQYQRSLRLLLRQAKHLDDRDPNQRQDIVPEGLAGEVSAEMSLSAGRMQAQLVQEQGFSGQAAHQLRTPLTALGLAIEELTLDPQTPRHVRADLHRARNEVDRLADIITDLLAVARRGALPSGHHATDPALLAVHATRRWAPTARAAGRDVRVTGSLPHCQTSAPAGPTAQVLDVLIDNALKHGTGDVEVSVEALADSVRLRVADQGTPERFRTEQHSTAGEGIGLRVAQELAAACGGEMVRAQHAITAFDLVLPRSS